MNLTSVGRIVSDVHVRAFILVLSDPCISVLVPFIHRQSGVVIQVDTGQRLETEGCHTYNLKCVKRRHLSRTEVTEVNYIQQKKCLEFLKVSTYDSLLLFGFLKLPHCL